MEPKLFDVPITVTNPMLSSKCDCKRRTINEVTIMDFPSEIMVEILSRLPIKPIFRCKSVCKRWYNLFSDPLFVKLYHTRSPNFSCILLSIRDSVLLLLELRADYDYNSQRINRPIMLSRNFHLPRPSDLLSDDEDDELFGVRSVNENLTLIGSCNGFICLLNGGTYDKDHSVCVSNPLLGEYFKLNLPEREKRVCDIVYGFCFSEASGQYKVLRLVTREFRDRPEVSELEVYTLGVDDNEWRNVGKAPSPLWGKLSNVNVNGTLHWMDSENLHTSASIYSFNIETEEVKSLPAPPGLETPSMWLMLAELGNCLCLSENSSFQHIDIWWMKEYGIAESWTKDRISITLPDIPSPRFIPIIIWKAGEILMQSERGTQLVSYNPKEKKFRKVNVHGSGTAATRYIPSFYSLKTVMGDNFQISNVYPKTEIV